MDKGYKAIAKERILNLMKIPDDQLDLVGRVLALEDLPIVNSVELSLCYQNMQAMTSTAKAPGIEIDITLNPAIKEGGHENVRNTLMEILKKRGIDTRYFFSYSNFSYGIVVDNLDVSIDVDE